MFSYTNIKINGKLSKKFYLCISVDGIINRSFYDKLNENEQEINQTYYYCVEILLTSQCDPGQYYDNLK